MHPSQRVCWLASADCSAMDQSVTFRRLKHSPGAIHPSEQAHNGKDTRKEPTPMLKKERDRAKASSPPTCVFCIDIFLLSFPLTHSLAQQTGWLVYMRGISTLLFALDERKCNPGSSLCRQACYLKRLLRGLNSRMRRRCLRNAHARANGERKFCSLHARTLGCFPRPPAHPLISFFRIPAPRVNVHIKAPDWLNSILLNGWKALGAR